MHMRYLGSPWGNGAIQILWTHAPRDTVPWARHQTEQLRARQDKVEDLGEEEQEQRLGVVRLNSYDCEGHACYVAERVAGKRTGGIPATKPAFVRSPTEHTAGRTSYDT